MSGVGPASSPPGPSLARAAALAQQGQLAGAMEELSRVLAAAPDDAGAHAMMGTLLHATGRSAQAVTHLEHAYAIAPKEPRVPYQLGAVLLSMGHAARGVGLMREAVALDPAWVQGMNGLANALYATADLDGAAAMYRQSLWASPGQADAMCGLAGVMIVGGRPEEAAALFREAARLHPANADVLGKLVSVLNYAPDAAPEESLTAHAAWGRAIGPGAPLPARPTGGPDRMLRVGLLSPDLYDHSCAYFLRPVLAQRDAAAFQTVCYSTSGRSDWMTEQLRARADVWRDVAGMPASRVADTIRADHVDVLIELSGHTALGPLAALRNRAAPVQATYLGYPNTTGLPTIDWRIVDATTDPDGAERWHTERLMRLTRCFLCYSAPDHAPPIASPLGGITFGSFNSIRKLNAEVIRVWAAAMNAVPGSRLLLKTRGLGTAFARRNLTEGFARHGIGADRLDLHDTVPNKADHLAWYGRVDVGLDTFPYNGTTTTCEALWMGVPVVSMSGRAHASRVGLSLLHAAGLPELATGDEAGFVRTATALANDAPRRAELRATMRARLSASELMDAAAHGRGFWGAVREMWRRHCTDHAP
jgi:protein O-GlcNAc transferase